MIDSPENILDAMGCGLFTLDANCRIEYWNGAMEILSGYSADQVRGQPSRFLACAMASDAPADECELMAHAGHDSDQVECRFRTKSGEEIPVIRTIRCQRDADGEIFRLIVTIADLRPLRTLAPDDLNLEIAGKSRMGIGRLIGKSRIMREVFDRIRLAANSEASVLVFGETGTGKELIAEAIHMESDRASGPLVKVNCSALSESLLESELFGHVKGAFTGAIRDMPGRFERADGGTIFLDEIGDISPLIQLKLLRVIQAREIERVGESRTRKINVRILAATHRDLRARVGEGLFREDLYYRLRVFVIDVPPLRKRKEDIPMLEQAFIKRFSSETGKFIRGVDQDVRHCFMDYCWPGNVRELENAIEHGFVTCQADTLGLFDIPAEIRTEQLRSALCPGRDGSPPRPTPGATAVDSREALLDTLKACGWNKTEAARRLGVDRATIWRKMKRWGIPLKEES